MRRLTFREFLSAYMTDGEDMDVGMDLRILEDIEDGLAESLAPPNPNLPTHISEHLRDSADNEPFDTDRPPFTDRDARLRASRVRGRMSIPLNYDQPATRPAIGLIEEVTLNCDDTGRTTTTLSVVIHGNASWIAAEGRFYIVDVAPDGEQRSVRILCSY